MLAIITNMRKNKWINLKILQAVRWQHPHHSHRWTALNRLNHTKNMLKLEIVHSKNHNVTNIDLPYSADFA